MPEAVIVDAVRSPMGRGKAGGALSSVHSVDLLAQTLTGLLQRTGIDPGIVEDFMVGCVGQAGEQSGNPGRWAWLAAGYPAHVPSVTIERKCGSGQQALEFAAAGIVAGTYDVVVAGGIESMSRVPMGVGQARPGPSGPRRARPLSRPRPAGGRCRAGGREVGTDPPAVGRVLRSLRTPALLPLPQSGGFDNEIVPITVADGTVVRVDETIRPGTTVEKLGGLRAVFGTPETEARLPQIDWKVTAGNASQITDGAGAMLVMSAERAAALGLRPRARIVASAVVGDDPTIMLTGPIPATTKVLERAGLTIEEMDAVEINEAFASVPLAWLAEFPIAPEKLNPCGGAIALGHPLGASGIRLMTTLINHLEQTGGRYGLQSMCEAGGMANATIIEILR